MYTYKTTGTCSTLIHIDMQGDIIRKVKFDNGCRGNLQGIARLVEGMNIHEVIRRTKGIKCQNNTSCPDQLSLALESFLSKRNMV